MKFDQAATRNDDIPPSFINLTVLEDMCVGQTVADAVITLGSVDIVLGEVDR